MRLALVLVAASAAVFACSSFHGDGEAMPTPDGGVEAGSPADALPPDPCGAGILSVAPDGNDSDNGCAPATAKRTISAAITEARTAALHGGEIHVCAGTYEETVVLDVPVSVRGGYSCNKFERTTTFGLTGFDANDDATGFDGASLTTVNPTEMAPITFTVTGVAVGAGVTVDGLTVNGPSKSSGLDAVANSAMLVTAGASPVIENCVIVGGAFNGNVTLGSSGIAVVNGAAPVIRSNRLVGGHGVAAGSSTSNVSLGSVAASVLQATAQITSNAIDAGDGTATLIGSAGVHVDSPSATVVIEGNRIRGGGTSSFLPSTGIYVQGSVDQHATVRGNRIRPHAAHCASGSCFVAGIVAATITSEIDGNIIEMGPMDDVPGSTPGPHVLTAISAQGQHGGSIVNNVLHGGTTQSGTGNSSFGLVLDAAGSGPAATPGDNVLVAHNTSFSGSPGTGGTGVAYLLSNTTNVTFTDNLALIPNVGSGATSSSPVGVSLSNCAVTSIANQPVIKSIRTNAFVGDGTVLSRNVCDGPGGTFSSQVLDTNPSMLNADSALGVVGNNVGIRSDCGGTSSSCQAASMCSTDCPALVITNWSMTTYGDDLLFAGGWPLASKPPCLVATGGSTIDPAKDILGTLRTIPSSIGAYEADGPCN